MASMATFIVKTSFPSHSLSKTFDTHFAPPSKVNVFVGARSRTHTGLRVSSGLIEPDGGKLVELVVGESARDLKKGEAFQLPRVKLSRIDVEWVHVLSEGWASPLRGFMRENEFLQTLHFNSLRLGDGSVVNMSVPIVLAIDDEQKHRIGDSKKVALFDSKGNPVAILNK